MFGNLSKLNIYIYFKLYGIVILASFSLLLVVKKDLVSSWLDNPNKVGNI